MVLKNSPKYFIELKNNMSSLTNEDIEILRKMNEQDVQFALSDFPNYCLKNPMIVSCKSTTGYKNVNLRKKFDMEMTNKMFEGFSTNDVKKRFNNQKIQTEFVKKFFEKLDKNSNKMSNPWNTGFESENEFEEENNSVSKNEQKEEQTIRKSFERQLDNKMDIYRVDLLGINEFNKLNFGTESLRSGNNQMRKLENRDIYKKGKIQFIQEKSDYDEANDFLMVFHRSRGAGGMEISFQNLLFIQCDQMAKLFFNIWPFTMVELCSH